MSKPTLLVLAAGMGSRYGGLKQMDAFGPNGETIIDYSIYDAIKAGFGKIVFIVRESFKEEFKQKFDQKFADQVQLEYVTQEMDNLPIDFQYDPERTKPWGTAHAVWVAKDVIDENFAVINADDFYGRDAYKVLADYLSTDDSKNYCVVAYYLKNTLSDHGTVNRGVCSHEEGKLTNIVECVKIARNEDGTVSYPGEDGKPIQLDENSLVSMNMWGFKKSYFEHTENSFTNFLSDHGKELKSEFYIPNVIDELIQNDILQVEVLDTTSSWFGVTYPDDKEMVVNQLSALIESGEYPNKLS